MLKKETLYALQDIVIVPAVSTDIKSRKECIPFRKSIEGYSDFYPLIAAPMDSVLDEDNWNAYWQNRISCIIPRTVSFEKRVKLCETVFCAFGLEEARQLLLNPPFNVDKQHYILIDIANGQMLEEINIGKQLKQNCNCILMGGNIAHPATYLLYDAAGFDFLRCMVGTGNACLTTKKTGVGYGSASLISEISEMKYRYHSHCKIIADGGMTDNDDICKALALGADYVMCGYLFAKAAKTPDELGSVLTYRGMSTKEAQKAMGNAVLKTAEGKSFEIKKEYTLSGWIENFNDNLRSSMSYCDSRSLKEYREKAICQVVSPSYSRIISAK